MNNIGPKKRKSKLEQSVGKWAIINVIGNGSVHGRIKDVEGREITLNPHRAFRYDKEKNCNLYKFVKEDSYLEVSPNGYYLEPTNKETLDYSIEKANEEILKDIERAKKE